jgi:hypothetical protein
MPEIKNKELKAKLDSLKRVWDRTKGPIAIAASVVAAIAIHSAQHEREVKKWYQDYMDDRDLEKDFESWAGIPYEESMEYIYGPKSER